MAEYATQLPLVCPRCSPDPVLHVCCAQRLFLTNFRPVPLAEHAVFGGRVFTKRSAREMREVQLQQEREYQQQLALYEEQQQRHRLEEEQPLQQQAEQRGEQGQPEADAGADRPGPEVAEMKQPLQLLHLNQQQHQQQRQLTPQEILLQQKQLVERMQHRQSKPPAKPSPPGRLSLRTLLALLALAPGICSMQASTCSLRWLRGTEALSLGCRCSPCSSAYTWVHLYHNAHTHTHTHAHTRAHTHAHTRTHTLARK